MYTILTNTSKTKNLFKDIRLNFASHPVTKQLLLVVDDESIRQSVKRIVLTNHYEKPFSPFFGANLIYQLFENFTPALVAALKFDISNSIYKYEPRVSKVVQVNVTEDLDSNGLRILVEVLPENRHDPIQIDLFIERIR